MRLIILTLLFGMFMQQTIAQGRKSPLQTYRAKFLRNDGIAIPFRFQLDKRAAKPVIYIMNAGEKLQVDSVRFFGDSVEVKMPLFESYIQARIENGAWKGTWTKGTSKIDQVMQFEATIAPGIFKQQNAPPTVDISGRWAANFASDSSKSPTTVAEFRQMGNLLTGSFLTPTGDYRYLQGAVSGNKLTLSTFDGSHAFLFTADITSNKTLTNGFFYSGATFIDKWTAEKNAKATVQLDRSAMYMKPGETRLNFRFPDLDSNMVSINDDRFKNKVVVIQIMGSWCPNCMDETAFMSEYYKANKQRGVEMVALAYEYSTDFNRSKQGLEKFKRRFQVDYPILITGVTTSDTLRTEKTLPQVTPIKVFPSSIILDKQGKVRKLDNGFYGPGTGEHHEAYKKEFYALMDKLLGENSNVKSKK